MKNRKAALVLIAAIISVVSAFGQNGAGSSFSPYSIFGPGNIVGEGSAYNKGMGGVGST